MVKDIAICITLGLFGHVLMTPVIDFGTLVHSVVYWTVIGLLLQFLLYVTSCVFNFSQWMFRLWQPTENVLFMHRANPIHVKIN